MVIDYGVSIFEMDILLEIVICFFMKRLVVRGKF